MMLIACPPTTGLRHGLRIISVVTRRTFRASWLDSPVPRVQLVSFSSFLLLSGAFVSCLGCAIGNSLPKLGILTGETSVDQELVIDLGGTLSNRILDLGAGEVGELLLLTSERAILYSLMSDKAKQIASFSEPDFLFPARIAKGMFGSRGAYVGVQSSGGCVLLLNGSGDRVGCYPASSSGEFMVADVVGDGKDEIIVETPDGKSIATYERSGRRIWAVDAGGYVTALGTLSDSEDGKGELIVHIYPGREGRGSGTYLVVSGDGRVMREWNGAPVGDVEANPWHGQKNSFLTLEEDAIVVTSPRGDRIQTMSVRGAGKFRDLRAAELASGHRVVLAKGGGYWPYYMLAVFTVDGELIYHEVGEDRGYGLVAPPWAEGSFFVSVGHQVLRYSLRP